MPIHFWTIFHTVDDPNKKAVSFGTTLDRGLFPHECAPDRTGNELYPLRGAPDRGPGRYNNAEVKYSISAIKKKID